ncbi:MAG TPA: glycine oxidase ThiO [Acidimicrobiia bacterium]|nr:glycine oxidase ThiO [Acidimicrobiia bacterium]
MPDHPDVAVIGGGVAGLGVAWRCAQRGLRVTVIDPNPGQGASHVAAGMIAPISEATYGEEPLLALAIESAGRWPTFAADLEESAGLDIGYLREGSLAVALTADDNRSLETLFDFQRSLGLHAERLRGEECRRLEPALAPGVRGGIWVPGEQQVDNRATTAALIRACDRAGVAFLRERASGAVVADERFDGVLVGDEVVRAATTVLAAGAWSGSLPGLPPEIAPPVRPVKGQILRLRHRTADRVLSREVWGRVDGRESYLVPRANGEMVIGGTVEEQGFDTTVTGDAVRVLLDSAFALVPAVDDLEFIEASAGLRPGTPDNAPILGSSPLDGLVFATGHYRHGFLLLPVTADAIATLIVDGDAPAEIQPFSSARFALGGVVG